MHVSFPANILHEFKIFQPKLVQGIIASGDQFISDPKITAKILQDRPATVAVEMEGAAVAQVCHDHDTPFVVIRTISDEADQRSHINFSRFINEAARYYAEHIIDNMMFAFKGKTCGIN